MTLWLVIVCPCYFNNLSVSLLLPCRIYVWIAWMLLRHFPETRLYISLNRVTMSVWTKFFQNLYVTITETFLGLTTTSALGRVFPGGASTLSRVCWKQHVCVWLINNVWLLWLSPPNQNLTVSDVFCFSLSFSAENAETASSKRHKLVRPCSHVGLYLWLIM